MDDTNQTGEQEKTSSRLKILLGIIRAEKGMSAKKMAKALECSPAYLSQVETGTTTPSTKFIKDCIQFFELPQGRAFELFTAAYEQRHSITLDLDEIAEQGILDKETLAKLLSILTISEHVPYAKETGFHDSPLFDLVQTLKKTTFKLWDIWFALFK